MGEFDLGPKAMADKVGEYADNGWVNILGGCCGTTPDHIRAMAVRTAGSETEARFARSRVHTVVGPVADGHAPGDPVHDDRRTDQRDGQSQIREIDPRGTVRRSRRNCSRAGSTTARRSSTSTLTTRCLDGVEAMTRFLRLISGDDVAAAVPVMIDSSKWEVLEAGLRNTQGKAIVNSISLKDGEQEFLRRARLVRQYGAAAVVMAFDEEGQAADEENKVRICKRAYDLLTKELDFPPEDIIFDPNILTVATGIEEHNNYAVDFINAVRRIKQECPGRKDQRRRQQYQL